MAFDDPGTGGDPGVLDSLVGYLRNPGYLLRKAGENAGLVKNEAQNQRDDRLSHFMYRESPEGKQDQRDARMEVASGFGPGHIGGAGIIRNVYHGTPRDIPIGGLEPGKRPIVPGHRMGEGPEPQLWASTKSGIASDYAQKIDETTGEGGSNQGFVHTFDLRWPDLLREAKDPLGYHHFAEMNPKNKPPERIDPDAGGPGHIWHSRLFEDDPGFEPARLLSITDPSLIHNERKQSVIDFLRSQKEASRGEYTTKSGEKFSVGSDLSNPYQKNPAGLYMPPSEQETFAARLNEPGQRHPFMGKVDVKKFEGMPAYSDLSLVYDDWKRQGVGSALYDEIEKKYGQMAPSMYLSKDAQNLWARRDPAALYKSMKEQIGHLPEEYGQYTSPGYIEGTLRDFHHKYSSEGAAPLADDLVREISRQLRAKGFAPE
jgi:hypothetical protein